MFNVEKISEMKNLKKTYETLQSTIVIHIMHVGKRNNHIKKDCNKKHETKTHKKARPI